MSTNNSRQALWVAVGQFFAFAIGIVSPMILSRYFNKGDYGTYKQVMYVYSTLLTVFTLGLPKAYAYFIPRVSTAQSKDIVRKISRLFFFLGGAFSVCLFFFAGLIATGLNNPDLELALKWFAPTPLLLLPVMGLDGILASYRKTQYIAVYTIVTRIFTLLCIILPVILFNGTYIHAIIGFDVASFLTFLLSLYLRNLPTRGVQLEKTLVSYKEIFAFSIPLLTASLWGMIIASANQFFVSRYYGNEVFAEFSNGFTEFPIVPMVTGAVAAVLMPLFSGMASHSMDNMKIGEVWMSALTKSVKLIYPMSVYCILFASLVMTCFYGSRYENSGVYFAIKNIESFFIIIPFFPIILSLGETKSYSNVHMIMAAFIVIVEYAIVKLNGSAYMIGTASVVCTVIKVAVLTILVARSLRMPLKDLIPTRSILKISVVSLLASVPSLLLGYIFNEWNKFLLLGITALVFVFFYYVLCWLFCITYKDVMTGFVGEGKFQKILKWVP